jgi:Cu/Ag efflux protein CusF
MDSRSLRPLAIVLPLALSACAAPETASAASSATALGVDLGSSKSLVPERQRAAAVGEGHERAAEGAAPQMVHEGHRGTHATGVVNAVDRAQRRLNISHNAIPEIGWPAMTMDFPAAPDVNLSTIKPGSHVDFTIEKGANGMYEIRSIQPMEGGR